MTAFRIKRFDVANPFYARASVSIKRVSGVDTKDDVLIDVFSDEAGTVVAANPIVLDGQGKMPAQRFVTATAYWIDVGGLSDADHETGVIREFNLVSATAKAVSYTLPAGEREGVDRIDASLTATVPASLDDGWLRSLWVRPTFTLTVQAAAGVSLNGVVAGTAVIAGGTFGANATLLSFGSDEIMLSAGDLAAVV